VVRYLCEHLFRSIQALTEATTHMKDHHDVPLPGPAPFARAPYGSTGFAGPRPARAGAREGEPRIAAFIWGGKTRPTPTLPYGRWKGAA